MKASVILLFLVLITAVCPAQSNALPARGFDEPGVVAVNFVKWYKANMDRLNKISLYRGGLDLAKMEEMQKKGTLVVDDGMVVGAGKRYKFIESGAKKYLSVLKSSGMLSDAYLKKMRKHFNDVRNSMRRFPQNDGSPDGLGYDLILMTHEPDYIFNNLDTVKPKMVLEGDKVNVILTGLVLSLSRYNGRWYIDDINTGL